MPLVRMFQHGMCAGFPSPADDYLDDPLDIGDLLVPNPPATFLWRVDGESMRDAGIFDKDLLVVDRSLTAVDGDVVVAIVDGELSLKRLRMKDGFWRLRLENADMPPFRVADDSSIEIWGVVRCNVHWFRAP